MNDNRHVFIGWELFMVLYDLRNCRVLKTTLLSDKYIYGVKVIINYSSQQPILEEILKVLQSQYIVSVF